MFKLILLSIMLACNAGQLMCPTIGEEASQTSKHVIETKVSDQETVLIEDLYTKAFGINLGQRKPARTARSLKSLLGIFFKSFAQVIVLGGCLWVAGLTTVILTMHGPYSLAVGYFFVPLLGLTVFHPYLTLSAGVTACFISNLYDPLVPLLVFSNEMIKAVEKKKRLSSKDHWIDAKLEKISEGMLFARNGKGRILISKERKLSIAKNVIGALELSAEFKAKQTTNFQKRNLSAHNGALFQRKIRQVS